MICLLESVYSLCNVYVAVLLVMSWCLRSLYVLSCAPLHASVALIGLLVLFVIFAGLGGDLSSNVCVAAILVMSWCL